MTRTREENAADLAYEESEREKRDSLIRQAATIVYQTKPDVGAFLALEACDQAIDGYWDAHGEDADYPTAQLIAEHVLCNEGDGELFALNVDYAEGTNNA